MKNILKFIVWILCIYFLVAGLIWNITFCVEGVYKLIHVFDNDPLLNSQRNDIKISEVIREEIVEPDTQQSGETLSDTDDLATFEVVENARITAYTKHDPGVNCISASQKNICWSNNDVIACPTEYPFGTIVEIIMPIDDEIGYRAQYICLDRMSPSHQKQNHWDIWFDDDLAGALDFGVKFLPIKVLKE